MTKTFSKCIIYFFFYHVWIKILNIWWLITKLLRFNQYTWKKKVWSFNNIKTLETIKGIYYSHMINKTKTKLELQFYNYNSLKNTGY